jgi:hypothetical protein
MNVLTMSCGHSVASVAVVAVVLASDLDEKLCCEEQAGASVYFLLRIMPTDAVSKCMDQHE